MRVPLGVIATATARTERVGRGYAERDGAGLRAARDGVDVWLELSEPVRVQRPWRERVTTTRLAIASDTRRLVARLLAATKLRPERARQAVLSLLDVAAIARDAAQPA